MNAKEKYFSKEDLKGQKSVARFNAKFMERSEKAAKRHAKSKALEGAKELKPKSYREHKDASGKVMRIPNFNK